MPNLDLERKKDLSTFRRLSIGTWETSYDSQVYGTIQVKMDRATEYIERFRKKTGRRLTVLHLVARAVGETLHEHPGANAILRLNRIYLRKRVGVFMQVAMIDEKTKKADLSGVTIYDVNDKTLEQIVDEVEEKVAAVRARKDPVLEKSRNMFSFIPGSLINPVLKLVSFLSLGLNLDLTMFGVPKDPFGSVMITNIGSLGLDMAYAPLVPYTRVPFVIALGEIRPTPVVEDGEITVRKIMKLNATFDHRFIDGSQAAGMARTMRDWLENPHDHFGPID